MLCYNKIVNVKHLFSYIDINTPVRYMSCFALIIILLVVIQMPTVQYTMDKRANNHPQYNKKYGLQKKTIHSNKVLPKNANGWKMNTLGTGHRNSIQDSFRERTAFNEHEPQDTWNNTNPEQTYGMQKKTPYSQHKLINLQYVLSKSLHTSPLI